MLKRPSPPGATAVPSTPAPTRIAAPKPFKGKKFMGMFGSSNEAMRAHRHSLAMEKIEHQFVEEMRGIDTGNSTYLIRKALIKAGIIEPVKTRKQKIIETAHLLTGKRKETPPHLVRYRMPEKTAAVFVMRNLIQNGPKRSWNEMGKGQQESYAKVVLRFVFAEDPLVRHSNDPRLLLDPIMALREHVRKAMRQVEERRDQYSRPDDYESALALHRRAYSVLAGVQVGIKEGKFTRLKL